MEKTIINYLEKNFDFKSVEVVERLLGGMSNYTYVVKCDGSLYTIRIPGDYSTVFVDNKIEAENIKLMEGLGITNKTVYLNVEDGVKLSKYIEGTSLNHITDYPYAKISNILKVIHNSKILAKNDYNPFARLAKYEQILLSYLDTSSEYKTDYEQYLICKERLMKYQVFLESQDKHLAHGDSQPSNFILSGDKLVTVDFEFTGNIDVIYDIACFANIRLEDGIKLLETYYPNPTLEQYKRFYLWRAFQCLQWFNVAWFKHLVGLSAKLHFEFDKIATHYRILASDLLDKVSRDFA